VEKGCYPDHVWPNLKTIDKYAENYRTNKFGWYVLNWSEPAPSFGNVMKTYILHPDSLNGKPSRVISVREALLVMGFNENTRFQRIGRWGKISNDC
jgi:DNA (cytosine-5)-methyltransferase 1